MGSVNDPGMTRERFAALAEAFGGEVARWPLAERDGAAMLMAADAAWTGEVLAKAGALDAALDAWRPATASETTLAAILASAPRRRGPRWLAWLSPAALGAGLAAACAAGVVVGVQVQQNSSDAQEVAVTNTLTAVSSTFDLEEGA
ncbi:hypothetical protein [Phenylobacterium soli]|uniref:hypothetical protein n=1 Tax=Phenylobacterium soli TaxID=2170551 RepID=UPI0014023E9C|nr:hypothetical protein [Phenylobacterium soli]